METINRDAYLITCMTNVHVGSGSTNFGVIDNLVQRDSISELPTINASSLKGALRQFCDFHWKNDENKQDKINYIFGPDTSRNDKDSPGIGHYSFFNADLLSLPVRSNKKPFYSAISPYLIEHIKQKSKLFGQEITLPKYEIGSDDSPKINRGENVKLEDYKAEIDETLAENDWLGKDIALFPDDMLKKKKKKLPVIARNKLENGLSENLWYEEIVPRESRFVFFIHKEGKYQNDFDELIESELLQIGANASVGMGYVKIKKMKADE